MKLEIENHESIYLNHCRVLAVIPQVQPYSYEDLPNPHVTCCGLNVRLEFTEEPEATKSYIESIVSKAKTVKCWIVKDENRIPAHIHGGNVGECYFGYINPTIFD